MPPARIVGLSPKFKGQSWEISQESYVIGRVDSCNIHLPDSTVSSKHASLVRQPNGSYLLKDEGSTNGTKVNGTKLSGDHKLANGDVFQVGSIELMFEMEGAEVAHPPKQQGQSVINLKTNPAGQKGLRTVASSGSSVASGKGAPPSKKTSLVFVVVLGLLGLMILAIVGIIVMKLMNKS